MAYGGFDGEITRLHMATSTDGVSWDRHGTTLEASGDGLEALRVHTPRALRLRDGSLHLWYSGLAAGDAGLAYRICSAGFPGRWSAGSEHAWP